MSRLDNYIRELNYCTYCPKLCTFACPVSNAERSEAYTPWAKMTLANLLRKGALRLTEENAEPLAHCLACRLCTTYCKHGNEVSEVLTAAREWASEQGFFRPDCAGMRNNFDLYGNTYGIDLGRKLHETLSETRFASEAKAVFFPGPEAIASMPEELTAVFSIFDKLGIDFVACHNGPDFCSGLPLYRAGLSRDFERHARRVSRRLTGAKLIITSSAREAYALKTLMPDVRTGFAGRVKHLSEFLEPYLKNTTIDRKVERKVAYHDSSFMGRFLGLRELPRKLLSMFCETDILEFVWNGESAYPAGTTGTVSITHPETSRAIAEERMRQAAEIHADLVVCAGPASALALANASGNKDIQVQTLARLIDECLGN